MTSIKGTTGKRFPIFSFWRTVVALIFAAGIYSMYARFALGFKVATNLTDPQPWGLWVGLGTLCGVGLSAGGFAIAASVYLLGLDRYRPILRTAVLISFLGYCTVCVGMLYELGLPWRIWHPIIMWNRHSVLFEVSWCVMLYTTVLALEFSPALIEKLPWAKPRELYLRWHHSILIALYWRARCSPRCISHSSADSTSSPKVIWIRSGIHRTSQPCSISQPFPLGWRSPSWPSTSACARSTCGWT